MAIHRCDVCGRLSFKAMGDLKREYGWTFHIVFEQEIARCGECQLVRFHAQEVLERARQFHDQGHRVARFLPAPILGTNLGADFGAIRFCLGVQAVHQRDGVLFVGIHNLVRDVADQRRQPHQQIGRAIRQEVVGPLYFLLIRLHEIAHGETRHQTWRSVAWARRAGDGMKWWLLALPGGLLMLIALSLWERQRARRNTPTRFDEMRAMIARPVLVKGKAHQPRIRKSVAG